MLIPGKPGACVQHLKTFLKVKMLSHWKKNNVMNSSVVCDFYLILSLWGRLELKIIISLSLPLFLSPTPSVSRKPRVQIHVPSQRVPAINLHTYTALTATGTTAVALQALGHLLWPLRVQPALRGSSVHATNRLAWLFVNKRKRKTRGAKPYRTAMSSLQTYKTRR